MVMSLLPWAKRQSEPLRQKPFAKKRQICVFEN